MDAAERALLEDAVGATLRVTGPDADHQLAELGWLEMLAAEPRDAIGVVFEGLGAANRAATLLDDVLVSALGVTPRTDLAVLLPAFGAWSAPGVVADGHAHAAGIATARVTTASELLVVCDAGPEARAVALGRRAIAHEMLGASRTMLDLARAHASERVQFGRSIGTFQAVRHRLADALVAIEALAATLGAAGDEPNALTAALAKATAGRTARTVAGHCQQFLAGIGFTTDHPFHRYLKRTMLLEGVLGTADRIASDIGRQLLADRRVPTLIEL